MPTEYFQKRAKDLFRAVKAGDEKAIARARAVLRDDKVTLMRAQHVIAVESGFAKWGDLIAAPASEQRLAIEQQKARDGRPGTAPHREETSPIEFKIPIISDLTDGFKIPIISDLTAGLKIPIISDLTAGFKIPIISDLTDGFKIPIISDLTDGFNDSPSARGISPLALSVGGVNPLRKPIAGSLSFKGVLGRDNDDTVLASNFNGLIGRGSRVFEKPEHMVGSSIFEKSEHMVGSSIFEKSEQMVGTSIFEKSEHMAGSSIFEKSEHMVGSSIFEKSEQMVGTSIFEKSEHMAGSSIFEKSEHMVGTSIFEKPEHMVGTSIFAHDDQRMIGAQDRMVGRKKNQ